MIRPRLIKSGKMWVYI
ncbi:KxYKxGKxW signal peptide domain-containing protein [Acinetobacter johnsonii]